jgi:hypothetical protein
MVRECFRDGEFEECHSQLAELDDDAVKIIMTDAVNRTYVFLSKLSNAMGHQSKARHCEINALRVTS